MLKSLYTLSEKYRNKKIVVYGVNRSSILVFAKLALNYQVDVCSFLDVENRFTGDYFVNRKIISAKQLQQIANDVIVIIPEAYKKMEVKQHIEGGIDIFYFDEILDLNEELRNKLIYIYGIGKFGEAIYDKLQEKGMKVHGVCVSLPGRIERWCGKEVLSVDQMEPTDDCAFIVATELEQSQKEMVEQLKNFETEKYVYHYMSDQEISEGNFFQVINIALIKNKNILIYSNTNEDMLYLNEIFCRYQIKADNRILDDNIYELEYEDIDNICVVIAENDCVRLEEACDALDSMGFGLEQWDYTSTGICTYKASGYNEYKKDTLIGDSTYINEKYPGYVVHGDAQTANVRIVILGGSTSTDNIYRTVSWGRYLYERMLKAGYSPLIFNGAVCAHGIVDEFLHMTRDIEPLKPDYIINFSGINNVYIRKTKNQFNIRYAEYQMAKDSDWISGVESDEPLYDFWCRISKLMAMVAEQHGAKTYHFLQPMNVAEEDLDLIETGMFDYTEHTQHIRAYKARASAEKDKFYVNLISMLGRKKMYIDHCHYSSQANKIIADRVFEVIEPELIKNVKRAESQS